MSARTEVHDAATLPRGRWWRRRPPTDLPALSHVIWWAGHGQLFAAPVSATLGVAFGILGFAADPRAFLPWAYLFAGAAAPFIVSGVMLRAFATSADAMTGSRSNRTASLTAAVLVGAGVWIVLTIVVIGVLLYLVFPLIESLPGLVAIDES
jgi:hypothetical protein